MAALAGLPRLPPSLSIVCICICVCIWVCICVCICIWICICICVYICIWYMVALHSKLAWAACTATSPLPQSCLSNRVRIHETPFKPSNICNQIILLHIILFQIILLPTRASSCTASVSSFLHNGAAPPNLFCQRWAHHLTPFKTPLISNMEIYGCFSHCLCKHA